MTHLVKFQHLNWAGRLKIPLRTGVLLDIGEKQENSWDTLKRVASIHQNWNHIQEVILQSHSSKAVQKSYKLTLDQH